MDSKTNQKEFERKWAQIFLDLINSEHNLDYKAEDGDERACDVLAVSKKHPDISLELSEAKKFVGAGNYKEFDTNRIENVIQDKSEHYSHNAIDNVILLIQTYYPREWLKEQLPTFTEKHKNSPFKGIYCVFPEELESSETIPNEIIAIKDAFN